MLEPILRLTERTPENIALIREAERCAISREYFMHDGQAWLISSIDVTATLGLGDTVSVDGQRVKWETTFESEEKSAN